MMILKRIQLSEDNIKYILYNTIYLDTFEKKYLLETVLSYQENMSEEFIFRNIFGKLQNIQQRFILLNHYQFTEKFVIENFLYFMKRDFENYKSNTISLINQKSLSEKTLIDIFDLYIEHNTYFSIQASFINSLKNKYKHLLNYFYDNRKKYKNLTPTKYKNLCSLCCCNINKQMILENPNVKLFKEKGHIYFYSGYITYDEYLFLIDKGIFSSKQKHGQHVINILHYATKNISEEDYFTFIKNNYEFIKTLPSVDKNNIAKYGKLTKKLITTFPDIIDYKYILENNNSNDINSIIKFVLPEIKKHDDLKLDTKIDTDLFLELFEKIKLYWIDQYFFYNTITNKNLISDILNIIFESKKYTTDDKNSLINMLIITTIFSEKMIIDVLNFYNKENISTDETWEIINIYQPLSDEFIEKNIIHIEFNRKILSSIKFSIKEDFYHIFSKKKFENFNEILNETLTYNEFLIKMKNINKLYSTKYDMIKNLYQNIIFI